MAAGTPIDQLTGIAGYGAGVVYEFIHSLSTAVMTGNSAEIVRMGATLVAIWFVYKLFRRSLRTIFGIFRAIIDLLVLVAAFLLAISIYNNGVESTMQCVVDHTSRAALRAGLHKAGAVLQEGQRNFHL